MNEMVVHQPQQALSLEGQMAYSKALAAASIIPKAYQNQPANILVAIGYAQALGEHPIAALTDVYVVEGRPSMSASMMHRRALEVGHRVRVTSTDTEAVVSIWRKDDPQHEHRIVWDLDRAKHAGLMGRKGPWQTYLAAMLRSRAVSEACRMACPEVLGPAKYTPDELGGDFADAPEGAPAAFARAWPDHEGVTEEEGSRTGPRRDGTGPTRRHSRPGRAARRDRRDGRGTVRAGVQAHVRDPRRERTHRPRGSPRVRVRHCRPRHRVQV